MDVFEAAARACREGIPAAMATVIGASGSTPRTEGARIVIFADGTAVGTIGGGAVEWRVCTLAAEVIATGRSQRYRAALDTELGMSCGGDMEIWIEALQVRTPALIFGAGHVAAATAPLLRGLDHQVTVIDDRPELLTEERFPSCRRVLEEPEAFARRVPQDQEPVILLMTHLHERDTALLDILLGRPHRYIGMLGSRRKVAHAFQALAARGHTEEALRTVCCPIGLDLAAETPAEIAVSIAAELVARARGATLPLTALSEQEPPAEPHPTTGC